MLWEVVLLLLILFMLRSWWLGDTAGKKHPPGPTIYPIIGSKFVQTAKDIRQLRKVYGNIIKTRMGVADIVLLCDYKLIKEAFHKAEVTDRPHWKSLNYVTEGRERGVIFNNGERWQNTRRFVLRNLRDLGMGKSHLDASIQEEAEMLVADFKKYDGKLTHPPESVNIAVLNVIWQLVACRRYDYEDQEIHNFIQLTHSLQDDAVNSVLPDIFPLVNYLPDFIKRKLTRADLVETVAKTAMSLMKEIITTHKAELDRNQPRDLIDEYLLEMEKEDSSQASFFCEEDLARTIHDLFIAGFDTTSNTLRWLFLYMADNPEIQKKVQEEIDSVVPRETLPSHLQRTQLPYTDATLHEVLRKSTLLGTGVVHTVTEDIELSGYSLPKGTNVLGCLVIVHEDPHYWPDPHTFNPGRFLDHHGKFVSPKEGFIPFGVGKRQCLGEALARMELFIFSTALLQNFTFAPPPNKKVDLSPDNVPFFQPTKLQEIRITYRK